MLNVQFAVNARVETVGSSFRRSLKPWGYLVSPGGLTKTLTALLKPLHDRNVPLIVDNGHFDDIARIATSVAGEIATAKRELMRVEVRLKRTPTWTDLSAATQRRRQRLASTLAIRAQSAEGMALAEQLELATTGVVGAEDITAALWLTAALDAPQLPRIRAELRRRNVGVAKQAVANIKAMTVRSEEYLAVASALDYDSAFDAGRAFGGEGLRAAAMGFGAFMADDSFIDVIAIDGRMHKLPRPLPARYLRTALVARGFWEGWKRATGSAPRRFHFLGLGAPIMMPLVALAGYATPLLTFDATSPIRDAVEGTFYSSRGAYLKIRARRIAERLATGQLRTWDCPCAFCRNFLSEHPMNYEKGRRWATAQRRARVLPAHLRPSGPLFAAYPLFAEPGGGALRKAVSYARSGHNHWVVYQVMHQIRAAARTKAGLDKHTSHIVGLYEKASSSSYFAEAVSLGLDIVRGRFTTR